MKIKGPKAAKGGWSNSLFGLSIGIGKVGYLIPLYSAPGAQWANLISGKKAHSNVPIVAILNRSNGAGSSADSIFATNVQALRAAGILVLGYVFTRGIANLTPCGVRNLIGPDTVNDIQNGRGVEQEIDAWYSFYSIDGIFLDNGPSGNITDPSLGYLGHTLLDYYQTATNYAKTNHGASIVFGNPGSETASGFIGSVNVINSRENYLLPDIFTLQSVTIGIGGTSKNWSLIAENNPSAPTTAYLQSIRNCVAWLYCSDSNSYSVESSYQNITLANLAAID